MVAGSGRKNEVVEIVAKTIIEEAGRRMFISKEPFQNINAAISAVCLEVDGHLQDYMRERTKRA